MHIYIRHTPLYNMWHYSTACMHDHIAEEKASQSITNKQTKCFNSYPKSSESNHTEVFDKVTRPTVLERLLWIDRSSQKDPLSWGWLEELPFLLYNYIPFKHPSVKQVSFIRLVSRIRLFDHRDRDRTLTICFIINNIPITISCAGLCLYMCTRIYVYILYKPYVYNYF